MRVNKVIGIELGNPFRLQLAEAKIYRAIDIAGRNVSRWHAPFLADLQRAIFRATIRDDDFRTNSSLAPQSAKGPIKGRGAVQSRDDDAYVHISHLFRVLRGCES